MMFNPAPTPIVPSHPTNPPPLILRQVMPSNSPHEQHPHQNHDCSQQRQRNSTALRCCIGGQRQRSREKRIARPGGESARQIVELELQCVRLGVIAAVVVAFRGRLGLVLRHAPSNDVLHAKVHFDEAASHDALAEHAGQHERQERSPSVVTARYQREEPPQRTAEEGRNEVGEGAADCQD
eukprot:CCRYP_009546-RA/>CCRYP_009546-RA protein AED:0.47 eAED:1.00 QI:0/0/0/1/0/0/2/0/180